MLKQATVQVLSHSPPTCSGFIPQQTTKILGRQAGSGLPSPQCVTMMSLPL